MEGLDSSLLQGHLVISGGMSEPMVRDPMQQIGRARAQQRLIAQLASRPYGQSSLQEAACLIVRAAVDTCGVSRASLWLIQNGLFLPLARSSRTEEMSSPPLDAHQCPQYWEALNLERVLDVRDAWNDPRTCERLEDFQSRQVMSVLEVGIRNAGALVGVLRLEQMDHQRAWHLDETAFAKELADHFAQLMANQRCLDANHSRHLFQRAIDQTSSACLLIDRSGRIEYANPSFTTITQFTAEEVQGRHLADLPALENLGRILRDAMGSLACNSSWQGEFCSRRKDQTPYWGHLSVSKIFDEQQHLTHYIIIYEDITEARLARQQIERLAYTDSLTGLPNRICFIQQLEARLTHKHDEHLALLLVDVDNFKRINDSFGHNIGDKLLVRLAQRLHSALGLHGFVARFASNEFAILMYETDFESGLALAQQLVCSLDDPICIDDQQINISGSVGLACAPIHGHDPQALLKHAGLALRKAKTNGKNQVQAFSETLNAEAEFRLFLENNLRLALSQNELAVYYQPKVCLRTGRLVGMEALLRWNHPERGMIRPDQFIPVAEETGLIVPIGNWAARQACRMGAHLYHLGMGELHMAINLSPRQFADPDLVDKLRAILQEEQLPPHLLELELTESLLLDATDMTHRKLNEFKAMGITLAMDDFGTGYSSLSYLKKFPIDVIKIDRSFVKDIPDNQDDMEITSAVVAMAHNLRLKVVAEGVETGQQLQFLRRQRCDIGQGYLFDRPIPGPELVAQLQRYQQ
ncbi:PAS domain S-box-containing protein/diguanylate cyclase (GGDEF)-like protein [Azomonas agilis]|uniref:cyclic-guanylate-specific phosphodiesterase n=2 Tax=Azomonas agilis TaxID=116849 RepID=A0A562IKB0_9GAMM|nr:GGDEF and EAL domain-containing protein [Azomonas agilis]TWH71380.1 PAS domain S-box-containing protein/diguanylate cyclase (GGDEF)-like protein [Azomonas agilis]